MITLLRIILLLPFYLYQDIKANKRHKAKRLAKAARAAGR